MRANMWPVFGVGLASAATATTACAQEVGGAWQRPSYVDTSRFEEEAVAVGAAPWELPGTLALPVSEGRVPAVVLMHGSGPQDRDETIGPNKPFRDLAWGLASRGVAVLRYEKRTKVHGAAMAGAGITVDEEVVEDALAALEVARTDERIDPESIFLLGHSLGGTLAPEIGLRDGRVAGVIILAGSTRPFAEVVEEQLEYIASLPTSSAPQAQAQLRAMLDTVALFGRGELPADARVFGAPVSYIHARDELAMVQRLDVPVLVMQGGRDYQVTQEDFGRWRAALADREGATFRLYADLNHIFVSGTGKATPQEYVQAGNVDVEVIDDITAWIRR